MAYPIPDNASAPLTTTQIIISAVFGAALWLAAALLLKFTAPLGVYSDMGRLLLYVGIIPGTLPYVLLLEKLAGLTRPQVFGATAFATATATLLDGLALAYLPALYGGKVEYVAGAGAGILWGAGIAIMLGFLVSRRAR